MYTKYINKNAEMFKKTLCQSIKLGQLKKNV